MSLVSAIFSAFSSQKAAGAQKRAATAALNLQKDTYNQSMANLAPFRTNGANAVDQYGNLLGVNGAAARNAAFANYQTDPAYDWQRNQAINAVQGSAAARGSLFSGNTLRGISDRTQNIANLDYGSYLQRLANLAAQGQNAAIAGGSLGQNYANAATGLYTDRGNASANSIMAPAIAYQQFENDVAKAAGMGAFG